MKKKGFLYPHMALKRKWYSSFEYSNYYWVIIKNVIKNAETDFKTDFPLINMKLKKVPCGLDFSLQC